MRTLAVICVWFMVASALGQGPVPTCDDAGARGVPLFSRDTPDCGGGPATGEAAFHRRHEVQAFPAQSFRCNSGPQSEYPNNFNPGATRAHSAQWKRIDDFPFSTRQELLLQAEQAGVASRFERRFLDGLGLDDEAELLTRLETAAVLARRGVVTRGH